MTTIAVKDGIIAFDSRQTRDNIIISDKAIKQKETECYIYFCTGCLDEIDRFIELHENNTKYQHPINVNAFIFSKESKNLFYAGVSNEATPLGEPILQLWKHKISGDEINAIGSGRDFAIAAMDLGMSAMEAIEYTTCRDIYTGGIINTFRIKD